VKVEAALTPVGAGRSQVRDVEATGSARLLVVDEGSLTSPGGRGSTELAGDDLKAHLLAAAGGTQTLRLDSVAGVGHTLLRQVTVDGVEQTSAGDTLDAKFRPGAFLKQAASGGAKASGARDSQGEQAAKVLASALQQGHVAVMQRVPAKDANGKEDVQHATAQRAAYDGNLDRVTLTGSVELTDAGSALWAAQVALDHATGDARAEGGVKADFVQSDTGPGGPAKSGTATHEPTHVLADRAELVHATRVATFFGAPVRLWQEGSQVQAPVIELARGQKRLVARGATATGAASGEQVHTLLVSEGREQPGAAAGAGGPVAGCPAKTRAGEVGVGVNARAPQVMRIASGGLTYSGVSREAEFTGGVRAEGDGGMIRSNVAEVYLQQPPGHGSAGAVAGAGPASAAAGLSGVAGTGVAAADLGSLSGRIERMVASGAVAIDEPRLHATGARLLYTASDQVFLLTGDKDTAPKAVDEQGRSTTGAALLFHACDASGRERIEALGAVPDGVDGGPAQRVRTDSRVEDGRTAKRQP
jgi:lipopolysaccharide export system protein LptA